MMRIAALKSQLAASIAMCIASVATGQETVPASPDSEWRHELTSISVPSKVAEFSRDDIKTYDPEQHNIGVSLNDDGSQTRATLYVYRAGNPDLRIWTDRASTVILSNNQLGKPDLESAAFGPFTPPDGSGTASGFRLVVPVRGKGWTSTGLAIFRHDGWLIKLRMSSKTLDTARLQSRMSELLGALRFPAAKERMPVFETMLDCAETLDIRKDAKQIQFDMMATLIVGTAITSAHDKLATRRSEKPVTWCRNSAGDNFTVYRPDDVDDSYAIAMGDAGVFASVGKFNLGGLVTPSNGYLVSVSDGVTEDILPPFNRLPKIAQMLGAIEQVSPIVSTDVRPGGAGEQTIRIGTQ